MSRACFHIHTKYSFDSLMNPKKILKICKKLNVDEVYITDHNTIRGSLKAKKFEKDFGVKVILGTEIKTEYGDIIGIHINEEIYTRKFEEVLEEIKNQGGISVLPHPYRGHKMIDYLASKVDLIEVWNGHCTIYENKKALELSLNIKKPPVAGSDAHVYSELQNAIMEFNTLFDIKKNFYTHYPSIKDIEYSNLIGHLRRGKLWNIPLIILKVITKELGGDTK